MYSEFISENLFERVYKFSVAIFEHHVKTMRSTLDMFQFS